MVLCRWSILGWVILPTVLASCVVEERAKGRQSESRAICRDTSPVKKNTGGKEILGPGLGKFIYIVGGKFTMGRNKGQDSDERPEHVVELASFFIGKTPVTNAQLVRFLNETKIKRDEYLYHHYLALPPVKRSINFKDGEWICKESNERDACGFVSWRLADLYCRWLSGKTGRGCRLPTEAEWEYVCRGSEGRRFPWGNSTTGLQRKVWQWRTWSMKSSHSVAVGSFPEGATPEGVCDLVGYMDEFCSDWYDPNYYANSPRMNPKGPKNPVEENAKVTRGGLTHDYNGFLHSSQFFAIKPRGYLPRGWSRGKSLKQTTNLSSSAHDYGRLGFRVVVSKKRKRKDGKK